MRASQRQTEWPTSEPGERAAPRWPEEVVGGDQKVERRVPRSPTVGGRTLPPLSKRDPSSWGGKELRPGGRRPRSIASAMLAYIHTRVDLNPPVKRIKASREGTRAAVRAARPHPAGRRLLPGALSLGGSSLSPRSPHRRLPAAYPSCSSSHDDSPPLPTLSPLPRQHGYPGV